VVINFVDNLQVKTHLQSHANEEIAVGHQHKHIGGMAGALKTIFQNHGIRGLWRGVTGAVMRVSVGSATQLTTFSWTKERIIMFQVHAQLLHKLCRFIMSHFSINIIHSLLQCSCCLKALVLL